MHPLRLQMQRDMTLRGLALRTQESYLAAVAALAKHYRRSPDQLSVEQVKQYLLYLLEQRKLSWSTCNQAVCAFRFFYGVCLRRKDFALEIPHGRAPQRSPEILSRDEVMRLIDAVPHLLQRTLLMTTYATGLRLSEVIHLKVSDIDRERMTVRVNLGKGARDRYTVLSPTLLTQLRSYWRRQRPPGIWLFPGRFADSPISPVAAQRAYTVAKRTAGITKHGGIHALRHFDWVVYAKPPFGGPRQVLDYLGRYTHKVAISEHRLNAVTDTTVQFQVRDRQDPTAPKRKIITLEGTEFLRRFLLHVLPNGFQRLRHYGITASRCKQAQLAVCRQQLKVEAPPPRQTETVEAFWLRITGRDILCCPDCGGRLRLIASLPPARGPP